MQPTDIGEIVSTRLKPAHRAVIAAALSDDSHRFRNAGDFIKHLIERYDHEKRDRVRRVERDQMVAYTYETARQLRELLQKISVVNDTEQRDEVGRTLPEVAYILVVLKDVAPLSGEIAGQNAA